MVIAISIQSLRIPVLSIHAKSVIHSQPIADSVNMVVQGWSHMFRPNYVKLAKIHICARPVIQGRPAHYSVNMVIHEGK